MSLPESLLEAGDLKLTPHELSLQPFTVTEEGRQTGDRQQDAKARVRDRQWEADDRDRGLAGRIMQEEERPHATGAEPTQRALASVT